MPQIDGLTPLFAATAAFAVLVMILTAVAIVTIVVNRHRPTIADAVGAEERLRIIEAQIARAGEELSERQGKLAEADKKASEVAWLEERLAGLQVELGEMEPRRKEMAELQEDLERLVAEIGEAQRAFDEETAKVDEVREAEAKLAAIEASAAAAEERETRLREAIAGLEGERGELEQVRADRRDAQAAATRAREELEEIEGRKARLEGLIGGLEAQIEQARSAARGRPGEAVDPLSDLRDPPSVLFPLEATPNRAQPADESTEEAYLQRTSRAIEAVGLQFHDRTIRAFHTSLKVAPEAPITVLAGISGTGKTQLPRRYAEGMGIGFLPMPVQPRWDSPDDLLGFYNFIEQRYKATELSRAMYQLDAQGESPETYSDRMLLVLLDEMNLARVEYYFSEFLSRLELRPPPDSSADDAARGASEILIEAPGGHQARIYPGHNLLFAGTMNEDESTQALSDKVLDRGNMLRFPPPNTLLAMQVVGEMPETEPLSYTRWLGWRRPIGAFDGIHQARDAVETLSDHMRALGRPFGHRVGHAMLSYCSNYPGQGGRPAIEAALADQVEMRLLPKLRGVELEDTQDELGRLAETVRTRLRDEALAEAIDSSVEASRDTERFAWRGLAR